MNPELDTNTQIDQPAILERAGFGDRFFAAFVDGIILNLTMRLVVLFLIPIVIKDQYYGNILSVSVTVLAVLIYYAILPSKRNGQTYGKKWNNIKVVDLDGNDLSMGHFVVREFVARVIPVLIGYWWDLTYLLALTNEKRALHDIITRTQVVKVK